MQILHTTYFDQIVVSIRLTDCLTYMSGLLTMLVRVRRAFERNGNGFFLWPLFFKTNSLRPGTTAPSRLPLHYLGNVGGGW